jgi:D-alanine-D-alanine ligase
MTMTINVESNPMRFGRVGLLLGGFSAEREISLRSGAAVLAALQSAGVDVTPIDPAENQATSITAAFIEKLCLFDRFFIALHGRGGEDGKVQALLDLLGKPYTGSGVAASAIAMDKYRTKLLWKGFGLPTPAFSIVSPDVSLDTLHRLALQFPVMVKPIAEGSSIGMSKCDRLEDLIQCIRLAGQYDQEILLEKYIVGEEYTVAIVAHQPLPSIRLVTSHTFYDYSAKYASTDTQYHCPSGLNSADENTIGQLALSAFRALGCRGWGRVDVMRDQEMGNFFLLEVNTVPGMTERSLVPMASRARGVPFDQLVLSLLDQTLTADGKL